jgi:dipeptidyl aminopeptidase/acylaminoacyl peptidase
MLTLRHHRWICVSFLFLASFLAAGGSDAGDRPLTFEELMQFRQIRGAQISRDGSWIAYGLVPDRGDGEAVVRSTVSSTEYRIERGSTPEISADGLWAVAAISPTLEEREKAQNKKDEKSGDDDKPKKGLSLVDLRTGSELNIEKVEAFAFSDDGRWLAYRHFKEKEKKEEEPEQQAEEEKAEGEEKKKKKEDLGSTLRLRNLATEEEVSVDYVSEFVFAEQAPMIAYAVSAPEGIGNGLFVRDLRQQEPANAPLHEVERGRYSHLVWAREASRLAFVAAVTDDEEKPGDGEIWIWKGSGEAQRAASREDAPDGYTIPSKNELAWSRDGERLFFGFKPAAEDEEKETEEKDEGDEAEPFDPYDLEALVEKRGVDVWHWNDPLIIPHQKERWEETERDRTYRAVVHIESRSVVSLADPTMPEVVFAENPRAMAGLSDVPYQKAATWDGWYSDLFIVDLKTGDRLLVAEKLAGGGSRAGSLSPNGHYLLYYNLGDWFLYDAEKASTTNLTTDIGTPFANEDHDYPREPSGYGHAEWLADDSSMLIYDKFDIWQFFTDGRRPINLTGGKGRQNNLVFRVLDLDPEEEAIKPGAQLLLKAYDDHEKHDAFFTLTLGSKDLRPLLETGRHRLDLVAKAEEADRILFTRESYGEFPDLWTSNLLIKNPTRLSGANPQIDDYAWGEAELVEWSSADGIPLQGVLIKPGNYEPGKRYPVLVYYYRFFSQRLNQFNEPVVNHRPSFPLYASNGYAVFLPDIRFEIGSPGFSATKCLVPGIQKLIDLGIADPDAIGLHGHSWSGYQTAFVITQTDIFAAAVAGAPVSNMTSAYSGIRWGSGLARQFQYEKSQSRIGGSLWEYPERYIENSPVFFADRIETPLLIQFGDEDGAVPWYQGIELYLACRRLGKECIFLQYRGEPHHLKKYPNKLDYSIKMKEFFDHHLKGEQAPPWMTEGVPYEGN